MFRFFGMLSTVYALQLLDSFACNVIDQPSDVFSQHELTTLADLHDLFVAWFFLALVFCNAFICNHAESKRRDVAMSGSDYLCDGMKKIKI